MILPSEIAPTLDGEPLANGDELAVYTPRGTCAGAEVWAGNNMAFPVWGDDVITEGIAEGFVSGEELSFRIWDASAGQEYWGDTLKLSVSYTSDPPYNSSGQYQTNGIYLLSSFTAETRTTVELPEPAETPAEYALAPNYPNPFNPSTTVAYDLPEDGQTTLEIFDMLGRRVEVLVDEHQEAGSYEVRFDATGLPSGRYIYRLRSGDFTGHGTMILAK